MKNKYKLLINLSGEMKKIYEKSYKEEKYDLLVNEDGIIIAKKTNGDNINIEHEELIIRTLSSMAKKYTKVGFLYIDLTKVINSILDNIENEEEITKLEKEISLLINFSSIRSIKGNGNLIVLFSLSFLLVFNLKPVILFLLIISYYKKHKLYAIY